MALGRCGGLGQGRWFTGSGSGAEQSWVSLKVHYGRDDSVGGVASAITGCSSFLGAAAYDGERN